MTRDRSIFIFGSCVTRDAFALVPNGYRLSGYVCRSSFGSSFETRPFDLTLEEIDPANAMVSQFQRSMVRTDLEKGLPKMLRDLPDGAMVAVDLIDERFQLLERCGTYATNSVEMQRPKPLERYSDIRVINANSAEHFAQWTKGVDRFAALVAEKRLRVVLNKAHWSGGDTSGGVFNPGHVRLHNEHLDKMYAHVESRVPVISVNYPLTFVSDHLHKWGLSPFHYQLDVYEYLISELDHIFKSD